MPKLLADFLHEQQEPFALEAYLLERGYPKGTSLDARSTIRNSAATRLAGCRRLKKKKSRYHAFPNCSEFVKVFFSRVLLHNNHRIKNSRNGNTQGSRDELGDEDGFSSASSSTSMYNSSENGSVEADADTKLNIEYRNYKQLSPVSVLEETQKSDEGSPLHDQKGESSTSISQHKSKQPTYEFIEASNSYDQYIINKRCLQQTKQLLIDCVREVIENHRKSDDKRGQQLKKILGADELWKLVCENVWLWSQDSIDETNIVHLLHYDFMASAQDWSINASQQHKEEISVEIGDAILEGIIIEIVTSS